MKSPNLSIEELNVPESEAPMSFQTIIDKIKAQPFYSLQVLALLFICGYLSFIYATCWGLARSNPYAIEYEGHVLWACMQFAQGGNIYDLTALSKEPWSVVIYNPFYFVIGGLLLKVFGTSFIPLRMLTMTASLLCFFSFGALLKRCRLNDFNTIVALVLFISTLPVLQWSSVARVDLLGLALSVVALERFSKSWFAKEVKISWACILFSLLALFTKQQYFVFMLGIVLFAFYKGQKRLGLSYLTAFVVLSAALCAIIQAISGGFWAHLTYAAGLPWEWDTIKLFLLPFLFDPKTIAAALIIGAAQFWQKNNTNSGAAHNIEALPTILLVSSFALALYTMGLRGAYHNHLLCSEFALCWLAGLKLEQLGTAQKNLAAVAILASAVSLTPLRAFTSDIAFCNLQRTDTKETINLLRTSPNKLILTEDPSLAIFAGAQPAMIDATTILNIGALHPGQLDLLMQRLEEKAYGAIIINAHDAKEHSEHIWRMPIVNAILKNYRPLGKSGGNGMRQIVFLPNP